MESALKLVNAVVLVAIAQLGVASSASSQGLQKQAEGVKITISIEGEVLSATLDDNATSRTSSPCCL